VENHRANIMKKLGLQSTVELVRYAAKLGLIDLDTWAS
jgi:DNA-binding CsgD family transcriptional regulator